jgi:hydroxymethylpyrimidine/phosphomethylpyrimidine kinase
MKGRVLIVAGSDSGGGAGIQADIKTVTALGGYAATAVTALTAQNTEGVFGVVPVDPDFVRRQMAVVLNDIGADAIKTGMLHDAAVIDAVSESLEDLDERIPVVVDPVMVAQSGAALLQSDAVRTLSRRLVRRAALLTLCSRAATWTAIPWSTCWPARRGPCGSKTRGSTRRTSTAPAVPWPRRSPRGSPRASA